MEIKDLIESEEPVNEVVEQVLQDPFAAKGWITPQGKLVELHDTEHHGQYVLDNPDEFGVDVDLISQENFSEGRATRKAVEKGAVRFTEASSGLSVMAKTSALKQYAHILVPDETSPDQVYFVEELPDGWTTSEPNKGGASSDAEQLKLTVQEFLERYG